MDNKISVMCFHLNIIIITMWHLLCVKYAPILSFGKPPLKVNAKSTSSSNVQMGRRSYSGPHNQLLAHLTEKSEVASWKLIMKSFLVIFPFPLIHEEQLTMTAKYVHLVLVNNLGVLSLSMNIVVRFN